MLVGIATLHLNWSTGQTQFAPFQVVYFGGAFATSSPYTPWIFSIGFPLGAIVYWIRRPRLLQRAAADRAERDSIDSSEEAVPIEPIEKPGQQYVGKWNWGACFGAPFWLMDHGRAWYGLLFFLVASIPIVDLVCIPAAIYCGIKGNAIAVRHRYFRDNEEFVAVQTSWRNWSLPLLIGIPLVVFLVLIIVTDHMVFPAKN